MKEHSTSGMKHYSHLAWMLLGSFIAMYVLMYAMTYRFADVFMNVNQVYMAVLMTAPMAVIELIVMRAMYQDPRLNKIIMAAAVLVGVAMFSAVRAQTAVADSQFLRSIIPHHSGAILMCERASITNPEIQQLCKGIISSQTQEIALMNRLLAR